MASLVRRDWPLPWPSWFARGLPERLRPFDFPELDEWFGEDRMRIEEFRENNTLVIRAELPGVDPDKDVEVTVDNGALTIRAERRQRTDERDEQRNFFRSEFRYGQLTRRVPLPAGARADGVTATYTDGVLEVKVPIDEQDAAAKQVIIRRE